MIIDNHNHIGIDLTAYAGALYPYAQSAEDLAAKAVGTPVDRWIVFPFVAYWTGDSLPGFVPPLEGLRTDAPYALANTRLFEEAEEWNRRHPGALIPFAMLDPERDAAGQVAALRALRMRHRFHGLKIQATLIRARIRALLKEGAPLLDLAEEWDLPFVIHSSVHPDDPWSPVADILKVARSRPQVRFVLAHSCRFDRAALDAVAETPNTWFDCSAHRIHCELAVMDSPAVAVPEKRFPSDYRDPARVLHDLAEAYPEALVWGSDSPYYSWIASKGDVPERLLSDYPAEWACVAGLTPERREAITKTNTLQWLGLNENDL